MKIDNIKNRAIIRYLIKFFIAFIILYYGSLAIIGLSTKEGLYSSFVHDHLDFITVLRLSLLNSSNIFCHLLGYNTHVEQPYILRLNNTYGVRMVYKCIGYGVMSFWGAFIISNKGSIAKKIFWVIGGWLLIYVINVIRISCLLISLAKHKRLPFNIDHHSLFNVIAYLLIFVMIYFYDMTIKPLSQNIDIRRSIISSDSL